MLRALSVYFLASDHQSTRSKPARKLTICDESVNQSDPSVLLKKRRAFHKNSRYDQQWHHRHFWNRSFRNSYDLELSKYLLIGRLVSSNRALFIEHYSSSAVALERIDDIKKSQGQQQTRPKTQLRSTTNAYQVTSSDLTSKSAVRINITPESRHEDTDWRNTVTPSTRRQ